MPLTTFTIRVEPEVAISLFLEGKLLLEPGWSFNQAESFLRKLYSISFEQLLTLTDCLANNSPLNSNDIPMFSDVDTLDQLVHIITSTNEPAIEYILLGYYLDRRYKKDGAHKMHAQIYGKAAALLGLAIAEGGKIRNSCLTVAYDSVQRPEVKAGIRNRLYLRIPVVREILYKASHGYYNAYESLQMFTHATMKRRGPSLRNIFKQLRACNCQELNRRIDNIAWTL